MALVHTYYAGELLSTCSSTSWTHLPQSCCWGCPPLTITNTHGQKLLLHLTCCPSLNLYLPSLQYARVTQSLFFLKLHCKVFLFSPACHDLSCLKHFVNEGHSSKTTFLLETLRNSTLNNFFNQISLQLFVKCLGHH